MTSFPHSPRKALVQSGLEKVSTKLVKIKNATPRTQPISRSLLSSVTFTEVPNTSSTKKKFLPTSGLTEQHQGIPVVSAISTFIDIPSISTIVSIPSVSIASAMIDENQSQPSTKVLNKGNKIVSTIPKVKGKEEEEEIDLNEDIVIPNWDISILTPDQMDTLGELLKKRAEQ